MARPAPAGTAASRQHQVEKMARRLGAAVASRDLARETAAAKTVLGRLMARGAASRTRGEAARWACPTGMMRMVAALGWVSLTAALESRGRRRWLGRWSSKAWKRNSIGAVTACGGEIG